QQTFGMFINSNLDYKQMDEQRVQQGGSRFIKGSNTSIMPAAISFNVQASNHHPNQRVYRAAVILKMSTMSRAASSFAKCSKFNSSSRDVIQQQGAATNSNVTKHQQFHIAINDSTIKQHFGQHCNRSWVLVPVDLAA
ncbi:hypothetical protein ACLOJK_004455, partial [Asimina triloba]